MKGLSPVMFEDFAEPFQVNLEEVLSSYCMIWLKSLFKVRVPFCTVISWYKIMHMLI